MIWPFGGRALYDAMDRARQSAASDAIHHALRLVIDRQTGELAAERERYDALLEKYHALKLAGASTPEPTVAHDRPTPDPLMQAITLRAAGNPQLRATMLRQLAEDRRNPLLSDMDIERRIQDGIAVDGVPI